MSGWYVENIREVQWYDGGPFGVYGDFERGERFPEVGFNFGLLWPGQCLGMYHREDSQEGFLVLSGECILLVEGEEHELRQWDYFHCPAGIDHMIVGAGDGPAFLIAVGGRTSPGDIVYPVHPLAQKYEAGVDQETTVRAEAYTRFPKPKPVPFDEDWLP